LVCSGFLFVLMSVSPSVCVACGILWRRPPSHPLFPYTTLFRSCRGFLPDRRPGAAHLLVFPRHEAEAGHPLRSHPPAAAFDDGRDRKSTRLNSSHVSISYAVFCLKKKKN